ncbi:ATP-dependent helicase HrpB [uncultured Desulfovibrio sp.]|uniref:ATP-dependent helicase HrpB n=1 Tax=uncultured Desulfovibrio sp. TaxID=167968 RepID=UPI002613D49E|nr:ATP-dependent helicase HrpB [uncultured Desulfovibrio sp.]
MRAYFPPLPDLPPCPLDDVRPAVLHALARGNRLVLSAQPGAGKSSRVPLWLLAAPCCAEGRILLLEPRRVAARALARYMAALMGERPGGIVGLSMRDERRVSARTRIEVVTEGVLTRMLQDNPELPGTACVLFDEFHERSLTADTGLALALESQAALRPDLRLAVMSATLDTEAVSALLGDCPVIAHEGRAFPVELRYAPPPAQAALSGGGHGALWRHMADVIVRLLRTEQGSLLAFLPGEGEIRQLAALLEDRLPPDAELRPLYGRLPAREQDSAVAPAPAGRRKVVLATSIAETSLTIEGVRLVADCGLTRLSRFDAAAGLSRLVTERISLAGAAQRAGRAGRVEPGVCCRLWAKETEHGMRPHTRPEILDADLSGLALQLAVWGAPDPAALRWLTPPPPAHLAAARQSLHTVGALDARFRPTALGRRMAALPLAPRTARLLLWGEDNGHAALAACMAALLEERDLPARPAVGQSRADAPGAEPGCDLLRRLDWLCREGSPRHGDGPRERVRRLARRLAQRQGQHTSGKDAACPAPDIFTAALRDSASLPALTAAAWPEQVAMRREEGLSAGNEAGGTGDVLYLLRSGRAVRLAHDDPLARSPFLAVAAADGAAPHGRVRLAAALEEETLRALFGGELHREDSVLVTEAGQVTARRRVLLGALTLEDNPLPRPRPEQCAAALCNHVRERGLACLPWDTACHQWRARVALLRELEGEDWPDTGDAALLASLDDWLAPALTRALAQAQDNAVKAGRAAGMATLDAGLLLEALRSLLPGRLARVLERQAPTGWQTPSGAVHAVVYGDEGGPWLAAKLQEFFGCTATPRIAGGRVPLTLRLNSPAGRPLQITRDLAHFWREGYPAVRAEMRGRYPKHPWPENPLTAAPTALARKKTAARGGR